jgi:hypothetical protein
MIFFRIDVKNIFKKNFENTSNIIWSTVHERACMKFRILMIELNIYDHLQALDLISLFLFDVIDFWELKMRWFWWFSIIHFALVIHLLWSTKSERLLFGEPELSEPTIKSERFLSAQRSLLNSRRLVDCEIKFPGCLDFRDACKTRYSKQANKQAASGKNRKILIINMHVISVCRMTRNPWHWTFFLIRTPPHQNHQVASSKSYIMPPRRAIYSRSWFHYCMKPKRSSDDPTYLKRWSLILDTIWSY